MKRRVVLVVATLALIMTGCAQKKLNTTDPKDTTVGMAGVTNGINGTNGTNVYQNVDPMGQGNGLYGNDSYGNDALYGDSGVQNIYFGVDQYNITSNHLGQISHNANLLRNSGKVKIEGHCDASGSDEYNYALGLKRAKAAKDALQSNGVPRKNMTLVSMGESSPECGTSSSAECYAKNRRVEFKVMQ